MKKVICMFMALAMLLITVFVFPSPVSADDYTIYLSDPYLECYLYMDSDDHAELELTVEQGGYYIIQTLGYFNYMHDQVESSGSLTVYDSWFQVVEESGAGGYDDGIFCYVYLEEGETYTLSFEMDPDITYFRLSITNAADYLNPREGFYGLDCMYVYEGGSSVYVSYSHPFANSGQNAVAFRVYSLVDSSETLCNYVVESNCCSCTKYRLIVPFATDGPTIYDMSPSSSGAPLISGADYYLVFYRNDGPGYCPDHDDYTEFRFAIVPADTL